MAAPTTSPKQWMLGLPGHNEVMRLEEVLLLLKGGQLRPTDLVKKLGEPWRAANEMPELMEYFGDPRKMASIADGTGVATKPPEEKPAPREATRPPAPQARPVSPNTTRVPPPAASAPRPSTARSAPPEKTERRVHPAVPPAPKAAPTGNTTRTDAKPDTDRREALKAETRPPESQKSETKPPAADEPAARTKPPDKTDPLNAAGKLAPVSEKPRGPKSRGLPKPPPPPRLEPMVGKYFGPGDLLRCSSFAFEPKKLLFTLPGLAGLGVLSGLLFHMSGDRESPREWAFAILAGAIWVFGVAFLWTALAYLTRRQLEGKPYSMADVVAYAGSNVATSAIYPLLTLAPSLASVGALVLFRSVRNGGPGGASFLKVAYFLPMAFALLAMGGAIVYQLASMYIPAAAAVEGQSLIGAVRAAWSNVRHQWGRVVLHWLIITVAVGVISTVGLGLAMGAVLLPEKIFGKPDDVRVAEAWLSFDGVFLKIYLGLAVGLGLTLPVSLLSTLGALSYLSLRHPAGAALSPSAAEETSGIAMHGSRSGSSNPAEQTQPGETRPAPPEPSDGGPGLTPAPADISDDSDEQPLVKES